MPPTTAAIVSTALALDLADDPAATPHRRRCLTHHGAPRGPVTGPELRAAARLDCVGPADDVLSNATGTGVKAGEVHGLFDPDARSPAADSGHPWRGTGGT